MKIKRTEDWKSWSITELTEEQFNIISYLVRNAQDYSGPKECEATFGMGKDFLDITRFGGIPLTSHDVEILHTIKL